MKTRCSSNESNELNDGHDFLCSIFMVYKSTVKVTADDICPYAAERARLLRDINKVQLSLHLAVSAQAALLLS